MSNTLDYESYLDFCDMRNQLISLYLTLSKGSLFCDTILNSFAFFETILYHTVFLNYFPLHIAVIFFCFSLEARIMLYVWNELAHFQQKSLRFRLLTVGTTACASELHVIGRTIHCTSGTVACGSSSSRASQNIMSLRSTGDVWHRVSMKMSKSSGIVCC